MLYERIAYFLPKRFKDKFKQIYGYAGFEKTLAEKFVGFCVLFSFSAGLVIFFLTLIFSVPYSYIAGIISAFGFLGLFYLSLILIADSRGRNIEIILPDCLQLISANIRAGMTIDKAIWLSARPEFGILEEEIRKVGVKTLGGRSIKTALHELSMRIRSRILDKTVKLLVEGIESGGELAHLLEETASNIRTTQSLQKEIRSSVMMYSLFIFFAAVIGAPLLFSISLYFIETTEKMWAPVYGALPEQSATMIKFSAPQISSQEIFFFAIASLLITTVLGSLIIGLIQYGEEKRGLKYIPFLTTSSLAVFLLSKFVLSSIFSGLFGF